MGYFSELDSEQSNFFTDTPQGEPAAVKPEAPASTSKEPAPALGPAADADDTAARQAHEAAEAQRKAEWDTTQERKRVKEQAQLDRISAMNGDELRRAAVRHISAATDKMTNRSMKESVSAHIQSLVEKDLDFARLTMHPRKSMLHCIQYIFRHARDYLQKELEAGGVKPSGIYGGDVPNGLCF